MHKLLIFLFYFLITSSTALAEIIKKIEINGNRRVSSETIKIYGDIDLKKNYLDEDLNTVLNNLYSTNFFEDVKSIELEPEKCDLIL